MKRYQCIKNVFYPKANPATGQMIPQLAFKAGSVYQEYVNDSWSELADEEFEIHLVTPQLLTNFKELLDLNVDDDPDAAEVKHFDEGTSAARGCLFACLITLVLFVATIMIWG